MYSLYVYELQYLLECDDKNTSLIYISMDFS